MYELIGFLERKVRASDTVVNDTRNARKLSLLSHEWATTSRR